MQAIGDIVAQTNLLTPGVPSFAPDPHTADELDERSRRYIAQARRSDAQHRWETCCPAEMRETDWSDARLASYRPQIGRILAWQPGKVGLLASGPTGRGKTRAMWALMRRLACEEGRDVRYWHATDWFTKLQSMISYGRDDAAGWVNACARLPIIFIDDIGQEAVMHSREDWAKARFFDFLDIRLGAGLPLFATTNLTAAEMSGRSGDTRGDPLVRRLLELCEPIRF